jgi:hypothetical protein
MKNGTRPKGVVPMIFAVLCILSLTVAGVYYLWTGAQKNVAETEKTTLEMLQETEGTTAGFAGGPDVGTGEYSYANIIPYVNWYFEDAAGTATNPTVYLYKTNPLTLSANGNWESERSWSDSAGTYWTSTSASSGKAQKLIPIKTTVWYHASLSGYEDIFGVYTVPSRGDIAVADAKSNSTGLDVGSFETPQFDTTALATAIDLGHDATNHTNKELLMPITSNIVADDKKVCLGEITLTGFNKTVLNKVLIRAGSNYILVYDENGVDKVAYKDATDTQTYDSDSYSSDKKALEQTCFEDGQQVNLALDVFADTTSNHVSGLGTTKLSDENTTFVITVKDIEGTTLVSAVTVTG